MELTTLQGQLKSAIQNHQLTLAKMKANPKDDSLQKKLTFLQTEIVILGEKQKSVVQKLRLELGKSQSSQPVPAKDKTDVQVNSISKKIQSFQKNNLSVCTGLPSQGLTFRAEKSSRCLQTLPKAAHQIIRHAVPSLVNHLVHGHPSPLFQNSSEAKESILIVPSPHATSAPREPISSLPPSPEGGQLEVHVHPIRVPQYPHRQSSPKEPVQQQSKKVSLDNCTPAKTGADSGSHKRSSKVSGHKTEIHLRQTSPKKIRPEDERKQGFMTSLGLVNRDHLNQLQSRRMERKRRTTANPRFSHAALEKKMKNALLNTSLSHPNNLHRPFKKPRGRPRFEVTGESSPKCQSPPSATKKTLPITNQLQSESRDSEKVDPLLEIVLETPEFIKTEFEAKLKVPKIVKVEETISEEIQVCQEREIAPASVPSEETLLCPLKVVPEFHVDQSLMETNKMDLPVKEVTPNTWVECGMCHLRLTVVGTPEVLVCVDCQQPYHIQCAVPHASHHYRPESGPWTCPQCTMTVSSTTSTPGPQPSSSGLPVSPPIEKEGSSSPTINKARSLKGELTKRRRELNMERTNLRRKLRQLADVASEHFKKQVELITAEQKTQDSLKRIQDVVTLIRERSS